MPTKGKLPQYCVNLLDTSYERVINIGQELVWWKMAAAADNHFKVIKIIFFQKDLVLIDSFRQMFLKLCFKDPIWSPLKDNHKKKII